jgi:PAP2 superfamily
VGTSVIRDMAPVGAAFALCPLAAALAPEDPAGPLSRTRSLVAAERGLGLFFEPHVYGWAASRPWLLVAAGLFYVWVHVPATVGALVWARLERPGAFALARDAFLATQALTVAAYLALPTAPPRLAPGLGFGDTLDAVYGDGAGGIAHSVQSPYAAMPSGHMAFAVVTAGIVAALARAPAVRAAALLYPPLVAAVITLTANHLWVDAVGGVTTAALGFGLARVLRRTRDASCPVPPPRSAPPRPPPGGAVASS